MREEYDFSGSEVRRNPYAKKLKKQNTININNDEMKKKKITDDLATVQTKKTLFNGCEMRLE